MYVKKKKLNALNIGLCVAYKSVGIDERGVGIHHAITNM